jgi:hypothetical protein
MRDKPSNYPKVQLLKELPAAADDRGRVENEQPLISECYKAVTPLGHLIQPADCPFCFSYTYESVF